MPKVTPRKPSEREVIKVKTSKDLGLQQVTRWWKAETPEERAAQMLSCAIILKDQQKYRYRQADIFTRLYSNIPAFSGIGTNSSKMSNWSQLPIDRPTMNVVQSCTDTLISRITQSRPRPVFLTDNADYKQRNIAKQLNNFIQGEFYQTKAYQKGAMFLLDAAVLGTGCWKVFETQDHKVGLDRVLCTELVVDPNDAMFGMPRQLFQFQLIDREVMAEWFPDVKSEIAKAEQAYPVDGGDASKTISDQIMVVEGWHLPSGPDADDGRHIIACSSGSIEDEVYEEERFPFVFMNYGERMLGFWGQSLAEQLMGTQVEINRLLMTISQAINLVGVPRVFVEDGSKVVKAHLNNQIGSIVTYRGTKPQYEVAPCLPAEIYAQLQRLVDYAYQQSGISALAAASQKPAGLDSGAALREYDDLQSDRFAALVKRYDNAFIDLSHLMINKARKIAERDGKYQTIYPSKNGTKMVDLPKSRILEDNPFVIQTFDSSSLPRDPAGRMQRIVEMIQSGMVSVQEGRRLLDYPDLDQVNTLAIASEERILKYLDDIVDTAKYTPPDGFMDLQLADQLCTQYFNLYVAANLDPEKVELLIDFSTQVKALLGVAMQGSQPPLQPQALPEQLPTSPMIPNAPQAA